MSASMMNFQIVMMRMELVPRLCFGLRCNEEGLDPVCLSPLSISAARNSMLLGHRQTQLRFDIDLRSGVKRPVECRPEYDL